MNDNKKEGILQTLSWVRGYLDAMHIVEQEFNNYALDNALNDLQAHIQERLVNVYSNWIGLHLTKALEKLGFIRGMIEATYHLYLNDIHKEELSQVLTDLAAEMVRELQDRDLQNA